VEITEQMVSAGTASAAILRQGTEEMQLDLFLDNRRTILNNLADEHLRKLDLEEAVCWIPVWGWLKGVFLPSDRKRVGLAPMLVNACER
jgi:hypothetical protein